MHARLENDLIYTILQVNTNFGRTCIAYVLINVHNTFKLLFYDGEWNGMMQYRSIHILYDPN